MGECLNCGKIYKSGAWYSKHVAACKSSASHNSLTSNDHQYNSCVSLDNEPAFSCNICGKTYKSRAWYEKHVASCNSNTFDSSIATTKKLVNVNVISEQKQLSLSCTNCGKAYKSRIWYEKHAATCISNVNQIGNTRFVTNSEILSKSKMSQNNILINCETCGKSYGSAIDYKKHGITCSSIEAQEKNLNYVCKSCGKIYKSEAWYEKHISACYCATPQIPTKVSQKNYIANSARATSGKTYTSTVTYENNFALDKTSASSATATNCSNSYFKCKKCGKTFTSTFWYEKHIAACNSVVPNVCSSSKNISHENNRNYDCATCGKTYKNEAWYEKHVAKCKSTIMQKEEFANFTCGKCGKTYVSKTWYEKHVSACHSEQQDPRKFVTKLTEQSCENKLACNICGKTYKSDVWYHKHIKACSNILHKQTSKANFICNKCGKYYISEFWYKKHYVLCNGSKKQSSSASSTDFSPLNNKVQLICQKCGKGYKMMAWYEKHVAACLVIKSVTHKDKQHCNEHVACCSNSSAETCLKSNSDYQTQLFSGDNFDTPNTENQVMANDNFKNIDDKISNAPINTSNTDSQNNFDYQILLEQLKEQVKNGLILSKNYIELETFFDNTLNKEQKYQLYITKLNVNNQNHLKYIQNLIKFYQQLLIMLSYGDLDGLKRYVRTENYESTYCELILNENVTQRAVDQLLLKEEDSFLQNGSEFNTTFAREDNLSDFTNIMSAINDQSEKLTSVPDVLNYDFELESSTNLQKALDETIDNNSLLASNFIDLEMMMESLIQREEGHQKYIFELCQRETNYKKYILKLVSCKEELMNYLLVTTKDELKKYLLVVNITNKNNVNFNMNNEKFLYALNNFLVKTETYLYLVKCSK